MFLQIGITHFRVSYFVIIVLFSLLNKKKLCDAIIIIIWSQFFKLFQTDGIFQLYEHATLYTYLWAIHCCCVALRHRTPTALMIVFCWNWLRFWSLYTYGKMYIIKVIFMRAIIIFSSICMNSTSYNRKIISESRLKRVDSPLLLTLMLFLMLCFIEINWSFMPRFCVFSVSEITKPRMWSVFLSDSRKCGARERYIDALCVYVPNVQASW